LIAPSENSSALAFSVPSSPLRVQLIFFFYKSITQRGGWRVGGVRKKAKENSAAAVSIKKSLVLAVFYKKTKYHSTYRCSRTKQCSYIEKKFPN